jgi:uracil phosphoribosyltransferase
MIKIIDHLLVQEKLTLIREENIDRTNFRAGIIDIGRWLAYELANTLEKEDVTVQTPLGTAAGVEINVKRI